MIFKRFRNKDKTPKRKKRAKRNNLGPSIITAEVVIDGDLLSGGELQIDGEINGDVRARAVVIDINGIVRGAVAAEDVIVRGRIIGPIHALHVHLLNGCHVEGDILNETISIENGAFIDGQVHRADDPLGNASTGGSTGETLNSYSSPEKSQFGFDTDNNLQPPQSNFPENK